METNKKNVVHASADCFGGTRVLVVKLDKTYQCAPDAPEVYKRPDMYEKVRKYWRVSAKRVERSMYVLGVFKGVVVAVYKPKRWYPVEDAKLFPACVMPLKVIPSMIQPFWDGTSVHW